MNKKDIVKIIEILKETYPDAKCSLDFTTPFEMLVAVCLSAQCTDERVNKTTPYIFSKFDTPEDFANADIKELELLVHPCGFYKNKAKNLKAAGQKIVSDFDEKRNKKKEEKESNKKKKYDSEESILNKYR